MGSSTTMEDVTATNATFSLPSIHDVNFNEAPPCFLVRLTPGRQEVDTASLDFHYHSSEEEDEGGDWPAERWAPLGAAYSSALLSSPAEPRVSGVDEQLQQLEEEQEQLNSSLLALTSHFAQVQFRLKQIISAEPSQREGLLKELEDFAFKGIPDVRGCRVQDAQILEEMSTKEHEERMTAQRQKQRELITQLKSQLEDLETYAYESGHADQPPTSRVMEKQKVVLEEIRSKLHINLQNFDQLSTEELREIVNNAITSIVNPVKVKEKLIDQLKTQVVDLERFIQFLQGETDNPGPYGEQRCTCPVHSKVSSYDSDAQGCCGSAKARNGHKGKGDTFGNKPGASEATATELMRKALTVLQIYVFSQLGCGGQDVNQNVLKKTSKGNDWGELRERLEGAITHTVDLALQQQERDRQWQKDCRPLDEELSGTDSEEMEFLSSPAVTLCVRKELAIAIRDLMQHGLVEVSTSSGMVRFGCFSSRSTDIKHKMHAWDLLAKFYDMKHGREYKESPTRMLSQSFHLDMVGGKPITAKQTLLGAIDTVLNAHAPHHHCGKDAHFKAFICLALNERKLVTWLRLLFRTQTLIDKYYQDWSYVARTGFEDALKSLERLLVINFHLPVDLSVSTSSGMVRFGCFSSRSTDIKHKMHAWDLLAKFYDMKHGREYKESPTRMLSQSFHLDMVGGKPITAKQTLLGAIDTVLNAHAPHHHCGKDAHFKAFICLALNERKLVTWLRLLFRTQTLIDKYYQDWSYVARTGFEDALKSLERLLVINFHLPVDLSVRSFNNIHDAF